MDLTLSEVTARLTPEPCSLAMEEQLLNERREQYLRAEQRRLQLEDMAHLRSEIFSDPRMARLWYLDGRPDKFFDLSEKGAQFDDVVWQLTGELNQNDYQKLLQLILDFFQNMDVGTRNFMIDRLITFFRIHGSNDLAEEAKGLFEHSETVEFEQ
ncbi:hypothetical protein [Nocardia thraciensis]